MNDFYEEPRHLNMKKVIIISVILIIIILSLILLIAKKISTPKNNLDTKTKNTSNSTVFYSTDNTVSVELSNSFNLKQYDSNLDYLIELRSNDNLNIFVSKENSVSNKELLDVVNADKIAFLADFSGYSNLSDIKELSVNNNLAYTYSFHYLDSILNTAFYLQVVWIKINDTYYIFDIEFPLNDLSFNTNIASSVLASFKVNK